MQRIAKAWHAMKAIWNRDKPGLGSLEADVIACHVEDRNGHVHLQSMCQGLAELKHERSK